MVAARLATIALKRPEAVKNLTIAARLASLAKKPRTTWLLWRSQIANLNGFIVDRLKEDEGLARRVPPQWFVRFGDLNQDTDRALALATYAMGRRTWRPLGRDTDPLWVHANGLAESGSADESRIVEELGQLKRARPREFTNFLWRVKSSKSVDRLWTKGRDKLTSL